MVPAGSVGGVGGGAQGKMACRESGGSAEVVVVVMIAASAVPVAVTMGWYTNYTTKEKWGRITHAQVGVTGVDGQKGLLAEDVNVSLLF